MLCRGTWERVAELKVAWRWLTRSVALTLKPATSPEALAWLIELVPSAMKVTPAVWVSTMPSVVSVAVKTAVPVVVDLTVKVAMPEELVVPAMVVTTGLPGPEVLASVTVLPATGLLFVSLRVAVRVAVAEPLANTVPGAATSVELVALTVVPTAVKVTLAV